MDFFTDKAKDTDLELGWRFFKKSWGKGYATEAASSVKEALIAKNTSTQALEYLSATAIKENHASTGIMKKIGMSFIKQYVHKDPLGDIDAVLYRMKVNKLTL